MTENSTIIVVVLGGVVQDVRFPDGYRAAVSIHDYDVGRSERGLHRDDEGGLFAEARWEPPELSEPELLTGIAEIDGLPEAEVREILAQVFQWMYRNPDTEQWDPDKDISGADTVQLLCELLPYPPEPAIT